MPPRYPPPHHYNPAKRPYRSDPSRPGQSSSTTTPIIPPSAYIQAYEAQLIYDQDDLAQEVTQKDGRRGLGLIQYAGEVEDEGGMSVRGEIWADRHDILHLLPSIPSTSQQREYGRSPSPTPSSSSSWSSLPSDLEETFNLSDAEDIEKYESEKKKRWIEGLREARLREREREDGESSKGNGDGSGEGGGSDEEPPPAILQLITHTARAILSSPNPSVLELRILTNHATDDRFSFLRPNGRYRSVWEKAKAEYKRKKEEERADQERKKGLGGLGDYASDSDEDEEEEDEGTPGEPEGETPPPPPPLPPLPLDGDDGGDGVDGPPPPPSGGPQTGKEETEKSDGQSERQAQGQNDTVVDHDEEEKKRLRRLRAEEWKRKRTAME
ncbi:hypothetical protein CI109_101858 [Kwoniella shandongensis]|uniref:Uncharacterized protein n=1 Tax=Kwoniella shandongensis TaxID=1734106 RepID=A0A5M6BRE9_9TREE|nr:uncharacterized protein CI109_007038 [Kwoniella shandongensis]KAA5524652.1 hypothetical protein CI109_007038 [Kwoniella shandongensis]